MTAFEYTSDETVVAVFPATPQAVWAEQVFEFANVFQYELTRFEELKQSGGDLSLDDGSTYVEGYDDAVEKLRNRFFEIFNVSETPAN
jgi:hypothetical protein